MTLSFADDFETANIIFTQCVEINGDYYLLIPEVVMMIQHIMQYGVLPESYGDNLHNFVENVLPAAVIAISQISGSTGSENKYDLQFFQNCVFFIPWCIENGYIATAVRFLDILNPKNNFYAQTQQYPLPTMQRTHEPYSKLMNSFLQAGLPNKVHELMKKVELSFPHYFIYFHVLYYAGHQIRNTIRGSEVHEIIHSFVQFIKTAKLREIDQNNLRISLFIIERITHIYIFDQNEQKIENINLILFLLNSDLLDKQLVASEVLVEYYQNNKTDHELLDQLVLQSNFKELILKPELHEEVLERLAPIISMHMDVEMLKQFYDLAMKSHITRQKIMIKIIEHTIPMLSQEDLLGIIDTFDLSKLPASLLAGLIPTIADSQPDKAKSIINELLVQSATNSELIKPLTSLFTSPNQIVRDLSKNAILESLSSLSHSSSEILAKCVRDKVFDESFVHNIIDVIRTNNNSNLYSILQTQFTTYSIPVDSKMVEELVSIRISSGLIYFFDGLIKSQGKKIFTKDSLSTLIEALKNAPSSYNNSLLKNIVLLWELFDQQVSSNKYMAFVDSPTVPTTFVLSRIPFLMKEFIMFFINCEGNYLADRFIKDIIEILSAIKELSLSEVADLLYQVLKECETVLQKKRIYELMKVSIDTFDVGFEPEDFHYLRNKPIKKMDWVLVMLDGFGEELCLTVPCFIYPAVLRQKIHFIRPDLPNFSLSKDQFTIMYDQTLLDAGVTNGTQLHMKQEITPYFKNTTIISVHLFEMGITKTLVESLKTEAGTAALRLLHRLPDDPYIAEHPKITKEMTDKEVAYVISVLSKRIISEDVYKELGEAFKSDKSKICRYLIKMFTNDFKPDIISLKASQLIKLLDTESDAVDLFEKLIVLEKDLIHYKDDLLDVLGKSTETNAEKLLKVYPEIYNSFEFIPDSIKQFPNPRFITLLKNIVSTANIAREVAENTLKETLLQLEKSPMICSIILKIIEFFPYMKDSITEKHKQIIYHYATTYCGEGQSDAVSIIIEIGADEFKEQLNQFFSKKIKNWNFAPHISEKSVNGVGIRNLGATCYMNAVLQQLFSLTTFVKSVFESEKTLESVRQLFSDLSNNDLPYADPTEFVNEWKWGNSKVNVFEQQDAIEFLSMFLGSLPNEVSKIFTGEYENVLTDEQGVVVARNVESFDNIEVEIKNQKSIQESLETTSVFPDYKVDDKKITVTKSTRVKKLPTVLVIQIKRFDYNLRTFEKIKVNDSFVFTDSLSLSNIAGEVTKYNLTGIVAHAGNAIGGHYTSYVKRDKWILFDDTNIKEAARDEMRSLYGSSSRESFHPNAYLLFYTLENEERYGNLNIPQKYLDISAQKAANEAHVCALFNPCMLSLAQKSGHLIDFFFNVYMHSTLTSLEKQILEAIDDEEDIVMKLKEREEDALECLALCPSSELLHSLTYVLCENAMYFDTKFVNKMLDIIENSGTQWRCVSPICKVLYSYVMSNLDDEGEFVVQRLANYLLKFYDKPSPSHSNVNFTTLFKIMKIKPIDSVKEVINTIAPKVMANEYHKKAFEDLIVKYSDITSLPLLLASVKDNPKSLDMASKIIISIIEDPQTKGDGIDNLFRMIVENKQIPSNIRQKLVSNIILVMINDEDFLDKIAEYIDRILLVLLDTKNDYSVQMLAEAISYFLVPTACIPPYHASTMAIPQNIGVQRYTVNDVNKAFNLSIPQRAKSTTIDANKAVHIKPKLGNFTAEEKSKVKKLVSFIQSFFQEITANPKTSKKKTGTTNRPILYVLRIAHYVSYIVGTDFMKDLILPLFESLYPDIKTEYYMPAIACGPLLCLCKIYEPKYFALFTTIKNYEFNALRILRVYFSELDLTQIKQVVENPDVHLCIAKMMESSDTSLHDEVYKLATKALKVSQCKPFYDACCLNYTEGKNLLSSIPKIYSIFEEMWPFLSQGKIDSFFRLIVDKIVTYMKNKKTFAVDQPDDLARYAILVGEKVQNPVLSEEQLSYLIEFEQHLPIASLLQHSNQIDEIAKTDNGILIATLALILSNREEQAYKFADNDMFWKAVANSPTSVAQKIVKDLFPKIKLSLTKARVSKKFIKQMSDDDAIELFGELTGNLFEEGVDQKEISKKLFFIASSKPDLKETFIGFLPMSKEEFLEIGANNLIDELGL